MVSGLRICPTHLMYFLISNQDDIIDSHLRCLIILFYILYNSFFFPENFQPTLLKNHLFALWLSIQIFYFV
jgi:hypothetical protein